MNRRDTLHNINKLRKLYQLKNVERANSVGNRKESPAEHSWSSLILADYFLTIMNSDLDRLKVYELLMYHDVVEVVSGDTNLLNEEERREKEKVEAKAAYKLKKDLPEVIQNKFITLFEEFEEQKTKEARFAKAVEYLDAEIHELDYKEDWKGWTEEFLRKKKEHLFKEFPTMAEVFEKTTQYAKENGYFSQ